MLIAAVLRRSQVHNPIDIGNQLYWPLHAIDVDCRQYMMSSPHRALICFGICDEDFDLVFSRLDQFRNVQLIRAPHKRACMLAVYRYIRNGTYVSEVEHDSQTLVVCRDGECFGVYGGP
jgi:hypothetical protein